MADELAFKLVVVGNGAVGKSSLIQRFCRGVFSQNYKQTIGKSAHYNVDWNANNLIPYKCTGNSLPVYRLSKLVSKQHAVLIKHFNASIQTHILINLSN